MWKRPQPWACRFREDKDDQEWLNKAKREISYHRVTKRRQVPRRALHRTIRKKYKEEVRKYYLWLLDDIDIVIISLWYTD
jgi:hypothetical protein